MSLQITVYTGPELKTVTTNTFYKKIDCTNELLALRNHIADNYPRIAAMVYASYDELECIKQQFVNLPTPNDPVPIWTGDLAMLIACNITLS